MTKCIFCNRGLNSTYVRQNMGSFKKISYSCSNSDIHFDKKLYTVNEKLYTDTHKTEIIKNDSNWPSFFKTEDAPAGI